MPKHGSVLLYFTETVRLIRTESPRQPPRLTQLLNSNSPFFCSSRGRYNLKLFVSRCRFTFARLCKRPLICRFIVHYADSLFIMQIHCSLCKFIVHYADSLFIMQIHCSLCSDKNVKLHLRIRGDSHVPLLYSVEAWTYFRHTSGATATYHCYTA